VSTTYSTHSRRGGVDIGNPGFTISSVLHAQKRRRRRRDPNESGGPDSIGSNDSSGELPDFELEDDEVAEAASKPKKISSNPDEITPAMMGSSDRPTSSIRDLLTDRSLESKLEFDEAEDDSLPDLLALARSAQQDDAATGKKKARQAERRAAAIAAKDTGGESPSILENIPFLLDEKGKVSAVKLLEAGAWAGISLLVVWEIYLNSPFFDRAAPMAPVVFESFLL